MPADIQRDLGRHDARLDAMEKDLQEVRAELKAVLDKLDSINTTLSTAKGGWKTLLLVGGAIATAFHFIGWAFDKMAFLFHR